MDASESEWALKLHNLLEPQSGLNQLHGMFFHACFSAFCSVMLMAMGSQESWAETATVIESPIHLSRWLNLKLAQQPADLSSEGKSYTPYLPGLVWMVPEEAQEQRRLKLELLQHINAENDAPGVSRADAQKLARFVESLPVTGRVVVERTDPRWLEVNPVHDPVLQKGQSILLPARPASVTVVGGDGRICQVAHSVNLFALDYVRACGSSRAPQVAWIVQPDGLVQRRDVANWNEVEQDPPAPGAWVVTDDPATPWTTNILGQLARLLATQGVAGDQNSTPILPQPAIQHEFITGQPVRPRSLKLSTTLMQTPTARMESAGETFAEREPYISVQ